MKKISIIIPVYYNEENLKSMYAGLREEALEKLPCDYEIIMVDDGSGDRSYSIMEELASQDPKITLVKLSRNFGEHAALLAGLNVCSGDCAVKKAADGQESSKLILELYQKYMEGNDVVLAVRESRNEPFMQRFFANWYASMMRRHALHNMPTGGFDSFLIDRKVIDVLVSMDELNTSLMSQILWSGFKTAQVPYTRMERTEGKSKWSFSKKVKLTIDSLLGFSTAPIRAIFGVGAVSFVAAIVWFIFYVVHNAVTGLPASGVYLIVMLLLVLFGVLMMAMGVLGAYLWRTFDAARKRPVFIIEKVKKNE
ncbi:MAG: glycosyltransferase family 2 protein [Christensenella sp.]|nr:glycosyltransferase family 2 protein [Christensenella sp.]